MKRPTFFISSTIYDFSDLRSSIKYFLEEQGCIVLASEFNDFRKPLDEHSYQACLDAIHQADYFVLLLGSRVGGWYDRENLISITQREYREAYKLHLKGKLKIVNFVRSDIWNLKSDRIELKRHLESLDIYEKEIEDYPTNRATDPGFIIDFITEIGRNKDTKSALSGNGDFPSGNWIHTFNSFRDIVDVLSPEIFDGLPIDEAILRKLLQSELREILRRSLVKFNEGNVYSPKITIQNFYHEHEIGLEVKENEFTSINTKRWDLLSTMAIGLLGLKFNPLILPQALSSSTFLVFSSDKGTFNEGPVYNALHFLQEEIHLLNKGNTSDTLSVVLEYTPRRRNLVDTEIQVESMRLLALLHLLQRWSNIIDITKAVIRYLHGEKFIMPKVFSKSPILEMNKELEKETVTDSELDDFVNDKKV